MPNQCSKARAEKIAKEIEIQSKAFEVSWFRLGRALDEAMEEHAAMVLGLSWAAFIEKYCKCPCSTAWKSLNSYRATKGLPEATAMSIGTEKAFQISRAMARLPEEKREQIIDLAVKPELTVREFAGQVRQLTGQPKEKEWVSMRVPVEVADKIEAALEKMARIFDVDLVNDPNGKMLCWGYLLRFVDRLPEQKMKALAGD